MAHYGKMGATLSGLLFGIAWWLFIDACALANYKYNDTVDFLDALPMTGVTIFFILLVAFDWSKLDAQDFEYTGGCSNVQSWARVCLFFDILIGFGSCIGSGILLSTRWSKGNRVQFGIKQLLGTIVIFVSGVVWRVARNSGDPYDY